MSAVKRSFVTAVAVIGVLAGLAAVAGKGSTAIDWLEGAGGYSEALSVAQESGRPLLLYFYTDWCPYCREFNRELLASPEVQEEVGSLVAVRVNPELGADEQALASRYGVRGYPAIYVHTERGIEPIRRTVGASGGVRLKTPTEFAATLAAASR